MRECCRAKDPVPILRASVRACMCVLGKETSLKVKGVRVRVFVRACVCEGKRNVKTILKGTAVVCHDYYMLACSFCSS